MSDVECYIDEQMRAPEFRSAWEAGEAEHQVRRALIEARAAAGLTQRELADAAGMDQRAVSRIEMGNTSPTVRTLGRIAAGLGKHLEVRFV